MAGPLDRLPTAPPSYTHPPSITPGDTQPPRNGTSPTTSTPPSTPPTTPRPPVLTQPSAPNQHSQAAWRSFDPETVRNNEGGVNHVASMRENARYIGEDALHLLPDRFAEYAQAGYKSWGVLGGALGFLLGLFYDLGEILAFPFMLVKNLIDIGSHGAAAAVNASNGESQGTENPADTKPFYYWDHASIKRQFAFSDAGRAHVDALTSPTTVGIAPRGPQ